MALSDPLVFAILQKDVKEVQRLLSHGIPVNYQVARGTKTPLYLAVGPTPVHTILVQLLLDHDATIEVGESYHGISPLMAAVNVQNYAMVELLLQRGANVNTQAADGKTPLIQMARVGNLKFIQLLLQWGAQVQIYDEQAKTALMYACSENRRDIVHYLLSLPTIHVNEYKVDTPLWHACAGGHADIVRLLIEQGGAQIEYRLDGTIYSTTPLMEACEWGHYQVVEILLYHGANVSSRTGRKALALARRSGYHKVIRLMELWSKRLEELERFVEEKSPVTVPASVLPLILGLTGRRPELTHRILRLRADVLASRGG